MFPVWRFDLTTLATIVILNSFSPFNLAILLLRWSTSIVIRQRLYPSDILPVIMFSLMQYCGAHQAWTMILSFHCAHVLRPRMKYEFLAIQTMYSAVNLLPCLCSWYRASSSTCLWFESVSGNLCLCGDDEQCLLFMDLIIFSVIALSKFTMSRAKVFVEDTLSQPPFATSISCADSVQIYQNTKTFLFRVKQASEKAEFHATPCHVL